MTTEQKVKELAYKIWEEEGYPLGNEQEHYFKAMQILQTADFGESAAKIEQPVKPRATRKRTTKASTKSETSAKKPTTRKRASKPKES